MSNKIGVVIGRFQIDELHECHKALLDKALEHQIAIIFLGVRATPPTAENPLSYKLRENMIREYVGDLATIMPLSDHPDDMEWSKNLDRLIASVDSGAHATLYCGRSGFSDHYHGKYKIEHCNLERDHISATKRRSELRAPIYESANFRAGVIHALQVLPVRTYHTVDMALLWNNELKKKVMICLGRREWETKYRFPGGFVNPNEIFADAAAREMQEETGLVSETGWKIIQDFLIPDWRIRDVKSVTHKTVLCLGWAMSGTPKGDDDLAHAEWVSLADLHDDDIDPLHLPLFHAVLAATM